MVEIRLGRERGRRNEGEREMGIMRKRQRQRGNKSKMELIFERDVNCREKIGGIKGNEERQKDNQMRKQNER